MKKIKTSALAMAGITACSMALASCAPKTVQMDFNNVPDNERCQYMKDVCKEAEAFQGKFQTMSRDEKEDAKVILNAYIQQCESAQGLCRQTQ